MKKIIISPSTFAIKSKKPIDILNSNNFLPILNPYGRKLTDQELINLIDDETIGIIAGLENLNRSTLAGTNIKFISRVGSGIDNVDINYINENNIKLFSTPNGPTRSVAELTISMIINLLRHNIPISINSHKKIWKRSMGNELYNKNVVIIGYGSIGKAVAKLLKCFDAKIYIVDPLIDKISDFKKITFEESLKVGEIFTVHSNSKDPIFTKDVLNRIQKNIYLLNSSRSSVISEDTVIFGLESGKIISAWLDVFDKEPYEGKLYNYSNLILTPHFSSFTEEARNRMELQAVNNAIEYLDGKLF